MTSHEVKIDPQTKIIEAALQVIYDEKISGARLRQIARQAGISPGHLHYYFPSKDALFGALLDHLLTTFVAERNTLFAVELTPIEKLIVILDQQKRFIQSQVELDVTFSFWIEGRKNPIIQEKMRGMYISWREDIQTVIDEGVKQGIFDPANAEIVPGLLVAMMDGAALQHLIDPGSLDLDAFFGKGLESALGLLSP